MIAFSMVGAEQQDHLSTGYGVAFTPKGQIVFGVDRMDLLHMKREVEAIRVYWPKFWLGIPRAVAPPEFDRKNLTELLAQERVWLNLTAAQDWQFAQAMWRAQAKVEEATDPEGTTLEELVEGTTLFLWKTMFPKECFPGADMIMRAETNSVVALLQEFRVHLGEGSSLVPWEIQPMMDKIQQMMLWERSLFE